MAELEAAFGRSVHPTPGCSQQFVDPGTNALTMGPSGTSVATSTNPSTIDAATSMTPPAESTMSISEEKNIPIQMPIDPVIVSATPLVPPSASTETMSDKLGYRVHVQRRLQLTSDQHQFRRILSIGAGEC